MDIRDRMYEHHVRKVKRHVEHVAGFCDLIADEFYPRFKRLRERKLVHDQSKLTDWDELYPYMFLSWKSHCRKTGERFEDCNPPEDWQEIVHQGTLRHVTNNRHHPEYHHVHKHGMSDDIISRYDRNAIPDRLVDATDMSDLDIAEMCADWCGVAQEMGTNVLDWMDANVYFGGHQKARWYFTRSQRELIVEILHGVWSS